MSDFFCRRTSFLVLFAVAAFFSIGLHAQESCNPNDYDGSGAMTLSVADEPMQEPRSPFEQCRECCRDGDYTGFYPLPYCFATRTKCFCGSFGGPVRATCFDDAEPKPVPCDEKPPEGAPKGAWRLSSWNPPPDLVANLQEVTKINLMLEGKNEQEFDLVTTSPSDVLQIPGKEIPLGEYSGLRWQLEWQDGPISCVRVAPPIMRQSQPYERGADYDGWVLSNEFSIDFNAPGIYNVQVELKDGNYRYYLLWVQSYILGSGPACSNGRAVEITPPDVEAYVLGNSNDTAFRLSKVAVPEYLPGLGNNFMIETNMPDTIGAINRAFNAAGRPLRVAIGGHGTVSYIGLNKPRLMQADQKMEDNDALVQRFILPPGENGGVRGSVSELYLDACCVSGGLSAQVNFGHIIRPADSHMNHLMRHLANGLRVPVIAWDKNLNISQRSFWRGHVFKVFAPATLWRVDPQP